ncbi:MAG: flagellar basal body P-ring formation chaperone FlgA [Hyphomicrobiaceae bacterium]
MRFGVWAKLIAACGLSLLSAVPAWAAEADDMALPVPTVTIYPGDVIEDDKITDRLFVARTVARGSVIESRNAVIGKVARRTLLPGKPIPSNAMRDAYAITQGKPALLVFQSGGLTITSTAVALQSGSVGDFVSARNADSGIVIKGTVQADGTIRIGEQ